MQDADLARTMKLSVAEGSLATVMGTLLGGVFLTGFALEMGASRFQIGILAALPVFVNLIQLFGAWLIEQTGESKRLCVWASLVSRVLWLPLLLLPCVRGLWPDAVIGWAIVAAVAAACVVGSMSGVAWLSWIKDAIPVSERAALFGRRNLFNTALALSLGMAAAFCLDWFQQQTQDKLLGFVIVFAAAVLCGLVGLPLLNAIPAAPKKPDSSESFGALLAAPLRERNFRRLIVFYACWNLSVQVAQPFFAVFMLEKLGMSFTSVTLLATLSSVLGLAFNNFWTRLCTQFGARPIVMLASFADALFTAAWLLVAPHSAGLLVLAHCAGLFNAPIATGANNILLRLAPERNASPYLAVFNSAVGLAGGAAAILGGTFATSWADLHWSIGPIECGGLKTLFLMSFLGRLFSVLLLMRVHEPSAEPVILVLRVLRRRSGLATRRRRGSAESTQRAAA